mmetsp:Transcript_19045/g.31172  ORF Transcript_19045/g.31172 Transcript_19045/m.31172 type:complete len:183 (+) Transcript_19045:876-1424(+)
MIESLRPKHWIVLGPIVSSGLVECGLLVGDQAPFLHIREPRDTLGRRQGQLEDPRKTSWLFGKVHESLSVLYLDESQDFLEPRLGQLGRPRQTSMSFGKALESVPFLHIHKSRDAPEQRHLGEKYQPGYPCERLLDFGDVGNHLLEHLLNRLNNQREDYSPQDGLGWTWNQEGSGIDYVLVA